MSNHFEFISVSAYQLEMPESSIAHLSLRFPEQTYPYLVFLACLFSKGFLHTRQLRDLYHLMRQALLFIFHFILFLGLTGKNWFIAHQKRAETSSNTSERHG
jgi:hypothetical protein